MKASRMLVAVAALAMTVAATPSFAQRSQGRARVSGPVGRAVPRGSVRQVPRGGRIAGPYRGSRVIAPALGYNAWGWGYPYGFWGSGLYGGFFYGSGWGGWGNPYWGPGLGSVGPYWGNGFGYAGGYPGYWGGVVRLFGGVRIDVEERDAQVFVDGYYAGVVDDFDGRGQQVTLEPGPHRIEIKGDQFEPVSFEVNVEPGRTITYRTRLRPLGP